MDIAVAHFTAALTGTVAPATLSTYARDVQSFLDHIGGTPLAQVRNTDIRGYLVAQMNAGAGPVTRARKLTAIAALYRVNNLPMPAVSRPKAKRRLPRTIAPADAMKAVSATAAPRDRALLAILYGAGLSLSEALALNVEDVVEHGRVRHEITIKGGEALRSSGEALCHVAPLIEPVRQANAAHLAALPRSPSAPSAEGFAAAAQVCDPAAEGGRMTGCLFTGAQGGRMVARVAQRAIAAIAKAHNLPLSARILRHSFASHLLSNGADVATLQEIMGHSQIATTQRYVDTDATQLAEVWRKAHNKA